LIYILLCFVLWSTNTQASSESLIEDSYVVCKRNKGVKGTSFSIYVNGLEKMPYCVSYKNKKFSFFKEIHAFSLHPETKAIAFVGNLRSYGHGKANVFILEPDDELKILLGKTEASVFPHKNDKVNQAHKMNGQKITFYECQSVNKDIPQKPSSDYVETDYVESDYDDTDYDDTDFDESALAFSNSASDNTEINERFLENCKHILWMNESNICLIGNKKLLLINTLTRVYTVTPTSTILPPASFLSINDANPIRPFKLKEYPGKILFWAASLGVFSVDIAGKVKQEIEFSEFPKMPGIFIKDELKLKKISTNYGMTIFPEASLFLVHFGMPNQYSYPYRAKGILFDSEGKPLTGVWRRKTQFLSFPNGNKLLCYNKKLKKVGIFNLAEKRLVKEFNIEERIFHSSMFLGEDKNTVFLYSKGRLEGELEWRTDKVYVIDLNEKKITDAEEIYYEDPYEKPRVFIWGNCLAFLKSTTLHLIDSKCNIYKTKIVLKGTEVQMASREKIVLGELTYGFEPIDLPMPGLFIKF